MFIVELLAKALSETRVSFAHNWPFLAVSVVVGVVLKIVLDQKKAAAFLQR